MTTGTQIEQDLNFSVDLASPDPRALSEGFNQYGVRETEDRVEFIFEAMQPGIRNGVNISAEFLQQVAENFSGEVPLQVDHSRSMYDNAGSVTKMWFSDDALRLKGYVPKTGADTHEEFVKRFTYDPPQVTNGSVGFGLNYEMSEDESGNPMLVDGTMQEFSLLPFPGGYDEATGGLKAQFEKARQAVDAARHSDEPEGGNSGEGATVRFESEEIYQHDTMTYKSISFSDLPEDLPEEVTEFIESAREAHESNIEFIESVMEAREEAEAEAENYSDELQEYKQKLADDLAERESVLFEADELAEFKMARLHKLDRDSAEFEASQGEETEASEEADADEEQTFGKKERRSPDFTGDRTDERAKQALSGIRGISLD